MIGIFDSGYGGLSTLKKLRELLPTYDYLYFGDNRNAPYGDKSMAEVTNLTESAVTWLWNQGCELVLVACNTASSDALRHLQEKFPRKVLGALIPAVEKSLEESVGNAFGIIGTTSTIKTGNYEIELKKSAACQPKLFQNNKKSEGLKNSPNISKLQIFSLPTPELVPFVEAHDFKNQKLIDCIKISAEKLAAAGIQNLILGCTHYGYLKSYFQEFLPNVRITDSGIAQAEKTVSYLKNHPEIEKKLTKNGTVQFVTSGDAEKFKKEGSYFLGEEITSKQIQKIPRKI